MARRKKSRRPKPVTDTESQELLATITRMVNAWEKHAPDETFAGMTLQQFREAVQPSFDAHAEVALLEWKLAQLKKMMGEEDPDSPKPN